MDSEKRNSLDLDPEVKNELQDEIQEVTANDDPHTKYPHGIQLKFIFVGLCLAVFLVALDNTIIATAIPRITDEFKAIDAVGWYASAYFLTTCAFQLPFGTLYKLFTVKWVYLVAITLFEIGSAICGAAPNSTALIIGRSVAGLGTAGVFSGSLVIIAHSVPLERRPAYNGILLSMYGIALIVGPLLGGAFTDHVSWRWCFYINLPIGAVTIVSILLFLKFENTAEQPNQTKGSLLSKFDILGTIAFIPGIVCLLLALQWGGSKYDWSDSRIIVLLVLFGVIVIVFCNNQVWKGDNATVPPRIICKRSMIFSCFFSFLLGGSYFIVVYFLPIWFQAIKEVSPTMSGVMCIPMILATAMFALLSGVIITLTGHYVPLFYVSVILSAVGAGLLTTFTVASGARQWIGYQLIYGIGIGIGFQLPVIACQVVLDPEDLPVGMAVIVFFQSLGGAIFTSAGESIFINHLVDGIHRVVPGVDTSSFLDAGATELGSIVPAPFIPAAQSIYNSALTHTWYISAALSAVSIIGALGMEWRRIDTSTSLSSALV